jgi:D-alanine-D-alanine ligase
MQVKSIGDEDVRRVAVIYQQVAPPLIDGARKDPKPGGYSDSGADIAYCLKEGGVQVITPVTNPNPAIDSHWVFPDTDEGLQQATRMGATVIWANTVLFSGHPLESKISDLWIVGQMPERQQQIDDKFATNAKLRACGLPVASSILVSKRIQSGSAELSSLTEQVLTERGLSFPLVVKPVRGRGSQGVTVVQNLCALTAALNSLFESGAFGSLAIVEEFLAGEELTLTVMRAPHATDGSAAVEEPLVLPPVRRFNHVGGIAPYNGTVAVIRNSTALNPFEANAAPVVRLMDACAASFKQIGALAPVRIDCRANNRGEFRIFDVNMKPNMTGAGRPGRDDQDSLSALAARKIGWSYLEFLKTMLRSAWTLH